MLKIGPGKQGEGYYMSPVSPVFYTVVTLSIGLKSASRMMTILYVHVLKVTRNFFYFARYAIFLALMTEIH